MSRGLGIAFTRHIFCVVSLESFFSQDPIEYKQFSNRSIWPIDRTLEDITTLDQSVPGSNELGNKGMFHIP